VVGEGCAVVVAEDEKDAICQLAEGLKVPHQRERCIERLLLVVAVELGMTAAFGLKNNATGSKDEGDLEG
jgi:hypothetical protein